MCNRYDRSVRAMLDDDLDTYVHDDAARLGISVSAVLRQALVLRRAHQRRQAELAREMAANEGAY